jgi:hypothetical protein
MHNVLLWNFSPSAVSVELLLKDLPNDMRIRHITLDASTASNDENARLRPEPFAKLGHGDQRLPLTIEAYGVHYWSLE